MTGDDRRHVASYNRAAHGNEGDARLSSPVFPRNFPAMIAALAPWLGQRGGTVLEIGSGTGQHAAAFDSAFPALTWVASDPYPDHRDSIAAWREAYRLPPRPALDLDAAGDWTEAGFLGPLAGVFAANVLHVSPWQVAKGIISGAGKSLAPGGLLIFYGPFLEHGAHTGEGNASFDAGLRADHPDWGVRDIADLGALGQVAGLEFAALLAMPANNRLFLMRKS